MLIRHVKNGKNIFGESLYINGWLEKIAGFGTLAVLYPNATGEVIDAAGNTLGAAAKILGSGARVVDKLADVSVKGVNLLEKGVDGATSGVGYIVGKLEELGWPKPEPLEKFDHVFRGQFDIPSPTSVLSNARDAFMGKLDESKISSADIALISPLSASKYNELMGKIENEDFKKLIEYEVLEVHLNMKAEALNVYLNDTKKMAGMIAKRLEDRDNFLTANNREMFKRLHYLTESVNSDSGRDVPYNRREKDSRSYPSEYVKNITQRAKKSEKLELEQLREKLASFGDLPSYREVKIKYPPGTNEIITVIKIDEGKTQRYDLEKTGTDVNGVLEANERSVDEIVVGLASIAHWKPQLEKIVQEGVDKDLIDEDQWDDFKEYRKDIRLAALEYMS